MAETEESQAESEGTDAEDLTEKENLAEEAELDGGTGRRK